MNPMRRLLTMACSCSWPLWAGAPAAAGEAAAMRPPGLTAALQRAHALRDEAVRSGDQPYGAVIVDAAGRIVGEAPSRVVARGDSAAHAEREALRDALQRLGRSDLGAMWLVSSSRPCSACEAAAARAGIARMFHGTGIDGGPPRSP